MNGKESEIINVTSICNKESNKLKDTLSTYGNKGKEKTSSTSKKKEKARDGYVRMYECRKQFLHSTYECACTEKAMYINIMEELLTE